MSFVLNSNLNTNVSLVSNYAEIGRKFCENYYTASTNNPFGLSYLYKPDSCISFMNEEFLGYNAYINRLRQLNISKFSYKCGNINVQPVGQIATLININGTVSVNDSIYTNRFTETFLIQLCENNCLFISNSIFKLIE